MAIISKIITEICLRSEVRRLVPVIQIALHAKPIRQTDTSRRATVSELGQQTRHRPDVGPSPQLSALSFIEAIKTERPAPASRGVQVFWPRILGNQLPVGIAD